MSLFEFIQQSPTALICSCFLLGLIIGSFLNVVIHRLPLMMQAEWQTQCQSYLGQAPENDHPTFSLAYPGSRCPHCQTAIAWYDNIPLLSYALLKAQCRHCQTTISVRYPLVELLTAICSAIIGWRFGFDITTLAGLVLTWALIAQSFIDLDHQLLADSISLPLLWLGLLLSLSGLYCDSHDSIIGAVAGYMSLWSVYQLFKLATGKEGMGYGDFKLLAMLGAWLGWQQLTLIIVLSSLLGSVAGITIIMAKQYSYETAIPFGPYLATAGWLALLFGNQINAWYLDTLFL